MTRDCFDCGQGPCHMNCGPVLNQKEDIMDVEECKRCRGSGVIGVRNNFRASYVGPGPVPEDARGVTDATCDECRGMGYVETDDE